MQNIKMSDQEKNKIKAGTMEFLKEWNEEDLKDAIAELTTQCVSLGVEVDVMKTMIDTLKYALYFNHISNLALHDLLIESNVINRKDLAEKIMRSTDKESLAGLLGIDFLKYIRTLPVDMERLDKWLGLETKEKINKMN